MYRISMDDIFNDPLHEVARGNPDCCIHLVSQSRFLNLTN